MDIKEFEKNMKFKQYINFLQEEKYCIKNIKEQDIIGISLLTNEQKESVQELLNDCINERMEYYKQQYKKIDKSINIQWWNLKRQYKEINSLLQKVKDKKTQGQYDDEMKLQFIGFLEEQLENISKKIEELINNVKGE